jgi:hypothetical protein
MKAKKYDKNEEFIKYGEAVLAVFRKRNTHRNIALL